MSKLLTVLLALCVALGVRAQESTRKITGTVTITKDNLHAPETKKGLYLNKC